jgi:hypothetical protein
LIGDAAGPVVLAVAVDGVCLAPAVGDPPSGLPGAEPVASRGGTIPGVRRFVLAIVVGWLILSASGVSTLIAGDPCTGYEFTGQGEDDGACPPTCVTCGCCAQAAEPVAVAVSSAPDLRVSRLIAVLRRMPSTDPVDILHVPKIALA